MSIYKNGKLVAGGRQCMPLLSFMWSDHILNDASWLRADTFSWQRGAMYQAVYQHLINEMVLGYGWTVTIAGTTLNTWTKSENPSVGDNTYTIDGVVAGVITSVSFNSISVNIGPSEYTFGRAPGLNAYLNRHTETVAGTTITFYLADDGHKICPASEEDNVTAIYNATGVAWYYIIDTTNQRFKLPRDNSQTGRVLIKTLTSGNKWARIYADGWVEQGGRGTSASLLVPMADTNYTVLSTAIRGNFANSYDCSSVASLTTTGFSVGGINYSAQVWFVSGYANTDYLKNVSSQFTAQYKHLYFYVGNFTQTALENTAGVTTEVLNGKADKDDAVGYCSYNTNTRIQVTTTAQTATKNGWLIGSLWFSGSNVYFAIDVDGIEIIHSPWATNNAWGALNASIPLKAGQTYRYYGNGTMEQNHLYFYPND